MIQIVKPLFWLAQPYKAWVNSKNNCLRVEMNKFNDSEKIIIIIIFIESYNYIYYKIISHNMESAIIP